MDLSNLAMTLLGIAMVSYSAALVLSYLGM